MSSAKWRPFCLNLVIQLVAVSTQRDESDVHRTCTVWSKSQMQHNVLIMSEILYFPKRSNPKEVPLFAMPLGVPYPFLNKLHRTAYHIEVRTKWPTFRRQKFHMLFLNYYCKYILIQISLKCVPAGPMDINAGSGNGLPPNRPSTEPMMTQFTCANMRHQSFIFFNKLLLFLPMSHFYPMICAASWRCFLYIMRARETRRSHKPHERRTTSWSTCANSTHYQDDNMTRIFFRKLMTAPLLQERRNSIANERIGVTSFLHKLIEIWGIRRWSVGFPYKREERPNSIANERTGVTSFSH